ncbi:MAG TPA: hypothetical protein VF474_03495, partial [Phenylobacterium sp.]
IQNAVSAPKASKTESSRPQGASTAGSSNLPVPITPVAPSRSFRDERPGGYAEFAAQIIGQGGERRGLRAGPPLMDAARNAYNRTEWSGRYDRRARKGVTAREDI